MKRVRSAQREHVRSTALRNVRNPHLSVLPERERDGVIRLPRQHERGQRQHGDVSCVAPPDGNPLDPKSYTVCQFPAPATVSVAIGDRTVIFQPGPGRPATVTVRDGKVSCVVGGWLGLGA